MNVNYICGLRFDFSYISLHGNLKEYYNNLLDTYKVIELRLEPSNNGKYKRFFKYAFVA